VSLARGAENIQVLEPERDEVPDFLPEDLLVQLFVLVPGDLATDQYGLMVTQANYP
jgi:hypothetical protein